MKTTASAAITLLLSTALAAAEPDTRSPLDRYYGDGRGEAMICKMMLKLALVRAEANIAQDNNTNWRTCVVEAKAKAKANFPAALKTVRKNKAQDALKAYHVAFISALDAIEPGDGERRIAYDQRQQTHDAKMLEAWTRFEIEQ